jgi:tetratricopeptide (TPR) repeat protein
MNAHQLPACLLAAALAVLAGCAGSARERREAGYDAIRAHLEAGDPQAALAAYDQAMQGQPAGSEDRLLRVELLLAAGRTAEARAELEALVVEYPELPGALAALGRLRQEDGDTAGARELFQRALRLEPGNFTALHGLGRILLEEENYAEALIHLDRALAVERGFSYAYADRARARAALEDWTGAAADLDEAVRLDPQDPWCLLDRGRLRLRARRLEEAEADFRRCLELDPENFLARVLRAGILDEQGRGAEAIADYEQALRLRPDYSYALAPLGILHYLEKNWDRAQDLFRQAYLAEPSAHSYALLAALCQKQAGRGKEAAAALRGLAGLLPPDSWELQAARYLADPALESRVLAWLTREPNRVKRGRLLFYLASQFLLVGRKVAALTYLAETAAIERRDLPERRIAAVLLQSYGHEEE